MVPVFTYMCADYKLNSFNAFMHEGNISILQKRKEPCVDLLSILSR